MTTTVDDRKIRESMSIRGICAAIMVMSLPTIKSVNALLESAGYPIRIVKINSGDNSNQNNGAKRR